MSCKIFDKVISWHKRHRLEGELLGLSDRLLNDIGIDRGVIQHTVLYGRDIDLTDYAKEEFF